MIQLDGYIRKSGKFWLAEVPALDLLTQGISRRSATCMLKDAIRTLTGEKIRQIEVYSRGERQITLRIDEEDAIIALMLRRQRQRFGLTLKELSKRLGSHSPNAYARYEQGRAKPGIRKLVELLQAVDKSLVVTLRIF